MKKRLRTKKLKTKKDDQAGQGGQGGQKYCWKIVTLNEFTLCNFHFGQI